MKTAMQELIDILGLQGIELDKFLAKEKQQIIDAFNVGNRNEKYRFENADQYHDETFKNE